MTERTKRLLFQFFLVAIAFVIIEFTLRAIGYKPGDIKPNWYNFNPVDTLYPDPNFRTTTDGLLIADSINNARLGMHINESGFRSPDFARLDTSKKKVLLIGDSFTYGMSATPIEGHCFADILRKETNYEVINTGIPAADPVQYEQIANKYIPTLKPDYVLVMFFMGNDLMKYERPIVPGEPYCYFTNAGALLADIDGKHFKNVKEIYHYILHKKYYLGSPKNIAEKIISKSALLSRLYSARFRIQEKLEYESMIKNTAITKNHLYNIKRICVANHIPLKYVLIPEIKEADWPLGKYITKYANILLDNNLRNDWIMFENQKSNFNNYPDAHLNNAGHRFYADSIKTFLKTTSELK
ncbi:MAG: hypothetical protein RLZZ367_1997 [Bacteroidota bacterium]